MTVVFERTGWRRYAVRVRREGAPDLVMDPAPGFDPQVPHDLLHLVVEARLGLSGGIFGQLARNGDAGTFGARGLGPLGARAAARQRRRLKKRGVRLRREGRADSELSEQATYLVWFEWLTRSASDGCRRQASAMRKQAQQIRRAWPANGPQLDDHLVDRICHDLDVLSVGWSGLAIGGSISVEWPDLSGVSMGADRSRRLAAGGGEGGGAQELFRR